MIDEVIALKAYYTDLEIFVLNSTDLLKNVEWTLRDGDCIEMADEVKTLYRNIENFTHTAYQNTQRSNTNVTAAYACLGYKKGGENDKTGTKT